MMSIQNSSTKFGYPWFEDSFKKLADSYNAGCLAHSLLINAADGCGKIDFATNFIQSLFCENSRELLNQACMTCKSCRLFEAGTHPDFYLTDCLTDSKGKQKKSIGIDQIRTLTTKLSDMAQLGGWRVALIVSVSAMTTASFNALLKTLEEPGQKTLLILLSDNLQRIPATIRSRCQIIQPKLTTDTLQRWLIEQTGQSKTQALDALKSCYNAPLTAKQYIENDGGEKKQQFYQLCDQILLGQTMPQALFELSDIAVDELWRYLAEYFNYVQISILTQQGLPLYQKLPTKLAFQLYHKLIEYNRAQIVGSNLQETLQLQAILIQWFEVGRKISR